MRGQWNTGAAMPLVLAGLALTGCSEGHAESRVDRGPAVVEPTSHEAEPAGPTARAELAPAPSSAPAPVVAPTPPGMITLPAGIFLMGSPSARGNPEEKPIHEAIVPSFHLDATEVTLDSYLACVKAGACREPRRDHMFCNVKLEGRGNHPVNCIDLRDATAYCAHAGKRLPTEREWEYAARAGSERRTFSWGEEEPDEKRACYDHAGGTCEVGVSPAGAFGLFDMSGNVWEWTSSRFVSYPSADQGDDIVDGQHYVYRGGSWSRRFPKWLRTANRNRYRPEEYSAALGVRCARSIEPLRCPAETSAEGDTCRRTSGTVTCEPGYEHRDGKCRLDPNALPGAPAAGGPAVATTAGADDAAKARPLSRSRTPQHDGDCQRHWPATPASYLFTGGDQYASRKPAVTAAGCVPRDMGVTWTSACCGG